MAGVFGPQIVARLYEATGSYETVLHVFSGLFAVALAVSILMTIYMLNARNRMTGVTLFKFDGQDFIRTETNLLTADGKSAINTKLDHDTPIYQALIHTKSHSGVAILLAGITIPTMPPLLMNKVSYLVPYLLAINNNIIKNAI